MKSASHFLLAMSILIIFPVKAQITFKTEYMGSSAYVEDMGNEEPPRRLVMEKVQQWSIVRIL